MSHRLLRWSMAFALLPLSVACAITPGQTASPPTRSSSATTTPAPAASATGAFSAAPCRLPVSTGQPGSGGFISFPTGSYTGDPSSNVQLPEQPAPMMPTAYSLSYDRGYRKWLPVTRAWVAPDGSRYVYPGGTRLLVVTVSSGTVTGVLGQGFRWQPIDAEANGVYAIRGDDNSLWLVPWDGSAPKFVARGQWQTVWGDAAYESIVSGPPGFQQPNFQLYKTQVVRLDLASRETTDWFDQSGHWQVVGFDSSSSPVIASTDRVAVYRVPEARQSIDLTAFRGHSPPALRAQMGVVGDDHGIWVPASDGMYLWTRQAGFKQIASVSASPAGTCG